MTQILNLRHYQRIVYARRRPGMTQEALAAAIHVDPVTLYRWEHGLTSPPQRHLNSIQDLLGERFIFQ